MKILLTLGATAEPVDGVRFITNFSSGATGSFIADELTKQGHNVKALCSKTAKYLPALCQKEFYGSFACLDLLLRQTLAAENFDSIIHLAAVSDFTPQYIICGGKKLNPQEVKKLPSCQNIQIKLKRNFKIAGRLKTYAKNKITVAAFKLTNGATQQQAKQAAAKVKGADFVIHNDLSEINSAQRKFTFYINGTKQKICPLKDLPGQIIQSALKIISSLPK